MSSMPRCQHYSDNNGFVLCSCARIRVGKGIILVVLLLVTEGKLSQLPVLDWEFDENNGNFVSRGCSVRVRGKVFMIGWLGMACQSRVANCSQLWVG